MSFHDRTYDSFTLVQKSSYGLSSQVPTELVGRCRWSRWDKAVDDDDTRKRLEDIGWDQNGAAGSRESGAGTAQET